MFLALHHEVVILGCNLDRLLDRLPAIFDWTRLGVFTGSRLGEYGQSKPRPGELFATVPNSPDASIWANTPLAFIQDDFTFYDELRHLLDCSDLESLSRRAIEVHVRFRFDKSSLNFSIRKFRRTPRNFMCTVKSRISILCRADRLRVPASHPIGVYRSTTEGAYKFIRGDDVSSVMCYACVSAYPESSHYMRQHIDRIVAHLNRVTACLALHQAGVTIDDIAFCLRWQVPSIQFYIRERYSKLGELTQKAVAGAALTN
jgi:hypothetical protein